MLRQLVLALLMTVLFSFLLAAQERPAVEVFGGYSLEHISPCGTGGGPSQLSCGILELGDLPPTTSFNGWDASLTGYLNRFVGATADFSGHYGTPDLSTSRYSYMFGPVFAWRMQKVTPFAHALFGRVSQNVGGGGGRNYNVFTWAFGGGLDVGLTKRVAVRLVQLEYERVNVPNYGGPSAAGLRYSAGVVFKF